MSNYNSNEAYDLFYFDDENDYENEISKQNKIKILELQKKREEKQHKKEEFKKSVKKSKGFINILCLIVFVAACCALLTYNSAISHELDNKIEIQQQLLDEATSENTQLEMKVETILSPAIIEKYASEVLNMSKLDDSKKEYIRLDEDDKVFVADEGSENIFSLIKEFFTKYF